MKTIAGLLAVVAVALSPLPAGAQTADYPSRPIHFIVPFPPGGLADIHARTVADRLTAAWSQRVLVENRPGAGGAIGTQVVARAAPDGYTLLFSNTSLAINPALRKDLPYDTEKALIQVHTNVVVPNIIVIRKDIAANTLQELIALARKDPGKLNFGSASIGSFPHLAMELFLLEAGVKMTHIPYAGAAPAMAALLGGEIDVLASDIPGALAHVKSGALKALVITSAERSPSLPDVPTGAQAGLPNYTAVGWQGVAVPAGTPPPIIDKLNAELHRILQDPKVVELFTSHGVQIKKETPAEAAKFFREEITRWSRVVASAGIKAE
jgi:tripartite-type tricarboxylate transporter receptor subunit TctC